MKACIDGKYVDWEKAQVPILSHSFARGTAIFEVMNILDTPYGPALFCLREHVERFFKSAELVYMDLPVSDQELVEAIIATIKLNRIKAGVSKFFAYTPTVEFGPTPTSLKVSLAIFCAGYDYFGFDPDRASRPVTVGISKFQKLHPDTTPLQAKVTGNYVGAYLAGKEVSEKGYDYALMCDTFGYVTEGVSQSVFFVKDGVIQTPPLHRVLQGTTREVIVEVAADLGIPLEETEIRPNDLSGFTEAFLTGSVVRVVPIKSIDGRPLGGSCPGPVTRTLTEAMNRVYRGEDEKYHRLLTFVDNLPSFSDRVIPKKGERL